MRLPPSLRSMPPSLLPPPREAEEKEGREARKEGGEDKLILSYSEWFGRREEEVVWRGMAVSFLT